MKAPILEIRGLGKSYRLGAGRLGNSLREALVESFSSFGRRDAGAETLWALRDVSLAIAAGEAVGVIGRNGAGKSTLLKILSRITEPTEGELELWGRVASLLEVGTGFHPELTGRENIYLNGTILGMRRREIDRRFDEIVAFAEVERFVDTPVKRYSSGMYVRLAFAVAAHLEPEILVVDEVLAVGDAAFQKKCLGKMSDIASGGRTVLFVSHNMAAVQRLCTRAVLLEHGRLVADGTPRDVVARYLREEGRPRYEAATRSGKPQVLWAELRDPQDRPLARPLSTDPFVLTLGYLVPEGWRGARVGIGVLSTDGVPIFTSDSRDAGVEAPGASGEYVARVSVPADLLLAGEFHLSTCLWDEGEIFDWQEPALTFAIEPGPSPLYQETTRRKGFVHVPCAWRIGAA